MSFSSSSCYCEWHCHSSVTHVCGLVLPLDPPSPFPIPKCVHYTSYALKSSFLSWLLINLLIWSSPPTPSLSQLASSFVFLKPTSDLVMSLLKMLQWLPTVLQILTVACEASVICLLFTPLTSSFVIP